MGHEKIHQMCVQFSAAELEQFRAVKKAFDPDGVLNPGKAIPQPRSCSEYKALGADTLTAPSRRDGGGVQ